MANTSVEFSSRSQHVLNYTVTRSTGGTSTATFNWSFTITTSGNTQQPFGTGSYNNSTSPATTFAGGTSNSAQSFGFDYRGTVASGLRNRTYSFSGGTRTAPAGSGDYTFTLSVDMGGLIGSATASIVISAGAAPTPAPSWTTTSFSEISRVGSSVLYEVSANNTTSYALASGSLPPGLSLNSSGFIFGTASAGASQEFNFVVSATGSGGTVNSNTFTINRRQPLPIWSDNTLNTTNLRVGTAFADSVSATNATSYTVNNLPAGGLTFSGGVTSATVSGTPTSTSSFSFTINALNADGDSISENFTFTPKPRLPVFTDSTLAITTVKVNQSYSDGVAATNATSYAVHSGALPAGISLGTTDGAIFGTPTTVGVSTFVIRATNSASESVFTGTLSLTVDPAGSGKVWNGSVWVQAPFRVWNGSVWVEAPVKVWNGSVWADPTS